MRIHVRWGYAVSLGVYIPAGDYDIDDPALHGLGQMLLDDGHALPAGESEQPDWMSIVDGVDEAVRDPFNPQVVYVTTSESATEDTEPADDDASGDDELDSEPASEVNADLITVALGMDYDNMTRAELRALWSDLGFEGASGMSKTELVEQLYIWRDRQSQG